MDWALSEELSVQRGIGNISHLKRTFDLEEKSDMKIGRCKSAWEVEY